MCKFCVAVDVRSKLDLRAFDSVAMQPMPLPEAVSLDVLH